MAVEVHAVKRTTFLGREVGVVLQNENGPCPLLAICECPRMHSPPPPWCLTHPLAGDASRRRRCRPLRVLRPVAVRLRVSDDTYSRVGGCRVCVCVCTRNCARVRTLRGRSHGRVATHAHTH
jgi:hypothetical protein